MHYTIEMLVQGDPDVGEYYRRAAGRWHEIWERFGTGDRDRLAAALGTEQMWFERNCGPSGNRWIGQEIMVVCGIGMLYSTRVGFEDKADRGRMLYDAFQRSFCSIEVKGVAREVAASYGLLEARVA